MTINVRPYDLPDAFLFNGTTDGSLIWKPDDHYIVLGQSNDPEKSLFTENIIADNIPVTKRPSGGEAVLLTPEMLVISAARNFNGLTSSKDFFYRVNIAIINALKDAGVSGLEQRGISDITIKDRKILGSSMHRKENRLVYHAVLNVNEDPSVFERYLNHPSREPGYRNQRKHSDFITSLSQEGYKIKPEHLARLVWQYLAKVIYSSPVSQELLI